MEMIIAWGKPYGAQTNEYANVLKGGEGGLTVALYNTSVTGFL